MSSLGKERLRQSETGEALKAQIEQVYAKVFSSEENFVQYFFATPDRTATDVLVRLGVFLKRIHSDARERLWLMRKRYANTEFPPTSLHRLDDRRCGVFPLNAYTQSEIESLQNAKLSTEREEKLQELLEALETLSQGFLPALGDSETGIVGNYGKIVLESSQIEALLRLVLPADAQVSPEEFSDDPLEISIVTSTLKIDIRVPNDPQLGHNIIVTFPRNCVQIDPELQQAFEEYKQQEVVPIWLENAINALLPSSIRSAIKERMKKGIFEYMLLTPDAYRHDEQFSREMRYFAEGKEIDLSLNYAQDFGLIPRTVKWVDFTPTHGHFQSVEQLWHALFNAPFSGEVVLKEVDTQSMGVEVFKKEVSSTHQIVINKILSEKQDPTEFTQDAAEVAGAYRYFTTGDVTRFHFPEGYSPIAVVNEGDYAIGFRRVEKGIELCFQLSNERIIDQIEQEQSEIDTSIRRLHWKKEALEEQKSKYLHRK